MSLPVDDYEMKQEYDFSKMEPIPNRLADYFEEQGVRRLDEDLRAAFPDSASVNQALRVLMQAAKGVVPATTIATAEDKILAKAS